MNQKNPKSKKVVKDAQFTAEDLAALGLNKANPSVSDDDGELVFGTTRPVTLMDGITMDPTGGITRASRDFGDDYGNHAYYD